MVNLVDGVYFEDHGIKTIETQLNVTNELLYTTAFVVRSPSSFELSGLYIIDENAIEDQIYYDPVSFGFYTQGVSTQIPSTGVAISANEYRNVLTEQASGKIIVPDEDGHPVGEDQDTHPATTLQHYEKKATNSEYGHVKIGAGINVSDGVISVDLSQVVLQIAYPVGAIYQSTNSTSPQSLFGGTWQAIGAGRVLVGAGSGYVAGTTGGNKVAKLQVANLPSHRHTVTAASAGSHTHTKGTLATGSAGSHTHISGLGDANSSGDLAVYGCSSLSSSLWTDKEVSSESTKGKYSPITSSAGSHTHTLSGSTSSAGSHTHTMTCATAGGGESFSVEQPYLVVYRWVRVA